jgi:uncharacterized protein YcfJ
MRKTLATIAAVGITFAGAGSALAQSQQQPPPQQQQQQQPLPPQQQPPPPQNYGPVTIPSGTVLSGTLSTELNTKNANPGDTFTLNNVTTANGDGTITGATIYGHVVSVQRAGQGKRPQIQLAFDRIVTPDGRSQDIFGTVQSMQQKTPNNTGKEVLGAVVGDIVGNYIGKHLGTDLGGLIGAGGGYLYAKNNTQNVSVPQGSQVSVQVTPGRQQRQDQQ